MTEQNAAVNQRCLGNGEIRHFMVYHHELATDDQLRIHVLEHLAHCIECLRVVHTASQVTNNPEDVNARVVRQMIKLESVIDRSDCLSSDEVSDYLTQEAELAEDHPLRKRVVDHVQDCDECRLNLEDTRQLSIDIQSVVEAYDLAETEGNQDEVFPDIEDSSNIGLRMAFGGGEELLPGKAFLPGYERYARVMDRTDLIAREKQQDDTPMAACFSKQQITNYLLGKYHLGNHSEGSVEVSTMVSNMILSHLSRCEGCRKIFCETYLAQQR